MESKKHRHPVGYLVLVGFAAVMIVRLMANDPATHQALVEQVYATQQSQLPIALFPELIDHPEQIDRLEVLDVTTGTVILLMRNEQALWYVPQGLVAEEINQELVEYAAAFITLMGAQQWYDATSDNFVLFGLQPQPAYLVRFMAHDAAGKSYQPVILEIGDLNPDHVAYYVWPEGDSRIYLIPNTIVDAVLSLVTQPLTQNDESPAGTETSVPVP
jgi:hypothetical protein